MPENIDLKIDNVLDMFCRFIKEISSFQCKIRREITTLEGDKIIDDKLEQIDQIAIGSSTPHETEIMRSTIYRPVTHITFMTPANCRIETHEDEWSKNRRLKCIDWGEK